MSDTWNTNKRRVVNRQDHIEWDYQFNGERYGNARKHMSDMKVAQRRTDRSVAKQNHRKHVLQELE